MIICRLSNDTFFVFENIFWILTMVAKGKKNLPQIKQKYVFLSLQGIKGKNTAMESLKLTVKHLCSTEI